jgi:glycosyltransferase involved in cell wall biosynthesis
MPDAVLCKKIKVVHLSSAHRADDTRIFWKECVSLARAGYDVCFVVAGDKCLTRREGVDIVIVQRYRKRFGRIVASSLAVVFAGLAQKGDLYHFHDPELIPGGLVLRLLGKLVIYDAHEDLPRHILFKDWIPSRLRLPVAWLAGLVEWIAGCALSGIVAATPIIAQRFPRGRSALVQNFARLAEFPTGSEPVRGQRRAVAYVGGVTVERCAVEMVEAMAKVDRFSDVRLVIAGEISPRSLLATLASSPGWSRVDYRGRLDRTGVRRVLAEASVGLAVFHPTQSYMESQPVKVFEYMAAGLPVIAADFPRFRKIIEDKGCGICVPPRDTTAIAAAIERIFQYPDQAEEMGQRSRELVLRSCNWEREAESLISFYDRILGRHETAASPARTG